MLEGMWTRVAIAVGVVVGLAAVVVGLLWVFQRQLYYFPDLSAPPAASTVIDGARDVTLRTSDEVNLGAWYVPAAEDEEELARDPMTILVANGNGGSRADRAELASSLSGAGFHVLLFDYRGYGGNPDSPSEEGLALDARAAYRYLTRDLEVPAENLLYFGESLGTGVVSELAVEHPPAGILLRSPFADLADVGVQAYPWLPVRWLMWDRYPVATYVRDINVPITVVYGTADEVVAPEHSVRVADAVAGPVEVIDIEGAGHNDSVMFEGEAIITAVERLAERARTR